MIPVTVHQPGRINAVIQFPTEWNELFPQELFEISKQQLLPDNDKNKAKAALIKFIINFRAGTQKLKLHKNWFQYLDIEMAVLNVFPLLDFIYDNNALTKPPELCIRMRTSLFRSKSLYGPGDTFYKLTCGEFEDAEQFFNEFYKDPDGKPLARLAAILWRPKTKRFGSSFGGERKLYTPYDYKKAAYKPYPAERMVKHFLKIEPWRLYSIYTWYTGCRNLLPQIFPNIHSHHGDDSSSGDGNEGMAFTNCIHAGAGPKNGTRQQIRAMNLYEYMYEMELEAKKAIQQKEEYERNKR